MSETPRQSLTEQQSRPLAVRDASVALSAGAGCGKTTVLTARFFGELDRPGTKSVRSVVALTFTEKAARELRGRIRAECRKRLDQHDDSPRWRTILRALEAARVGTFHEFCGNWLREHALEARLDPDFGILDETIAGTIREEALSRCLRILLARKDPDLILLAAEYGLRSVREALSALLARRDVDGLEAWIKESAQAIVARWRAAWEERERPGLFAGVCALGRAAFQSLADAEFTHPKLIEMQTTLCEQLPALDFWCDNDDALAGLRAQALLPKGLRTTHWPSPEIKDDIASRLKAFRDGIDGFRKQNQWSEPAALQFAEHGLRFGRLARAARAEYAKAKRARVGLDFDDLLINTRDLLRDSDENVRNALADSIELLLVDEFQDTDPVQNDILNRLAGTGYLNGRLFIVGDFKQSIYRFRGAEPRIFQQVRAEFPEAGRLDLTENFRSAAGILDFVNLLFQEAFEGEASPPLLPGKPLPKTNDEPAVEFVWATEPESLHADRPTKISVNQARRTEARWLAKHLRQKLDEGWLVRDRESNHVRPVQPNDIALLFRALTDVGVYESALRDEGLDYYTVGGSAFYIQQEINDVINVLSAIEDPFDAVALAGALRGPFFGLSDNGLYWLATARQGLTEGLEHLEESTRLSTVDRERALRARRLLAQWRRLKDQVPMSALIDRALDESGYEAALLAEPLGDRKRANARKLVRKARDFDRQGGFTLAQFVAGLRSELREPSREEQAATTDETGECIRLMSIHRAKGLEFPVVVLPDLNRKSSAEGPCASFDPELGLLVRPSKEREGVDEASDQESLGWRVYRLRERREEDAEALRLFYVATTRARDLLILSAGVGAADGVQSTALRRLDTVFDRQTGECRVAVPEGWGVPRVRVVDKPTDGPDQRALRRDTRPSLAEVASVIHGTPLAASSTASQRMTGRATVTVLDQAQSRGASAQRLDRLVRSIVSDVKHLNARDLPDAAHRVARRQVPAAHAGLVREAVDRLTPWLTGALGRILERARRVEPGQAWTVAWPPRSRNPSIFEGRFDLLYEEPDGSWGVVLLCDESAPGPSERLRLLLSALAAEQLGYAPVLQAWQIRLGPGGGISGEDVFNDQAIEFAIRALGR